jgi:hypothetical protein
VYVPVTVVWAPAFTVMLCQAGAVGAGPDADIGAASTNEMNRATASAEEARSRDIANRTDGLGFVGKVAPLPLASLGTRPLPY